MKSFGVLLALASATSAQIASYNALGNAIRTEVSRLNALVTAYTGGVSAGQAALQQGTSVLNAIQKGVASAQGLEKLPDLTVALSLLNVFGRESGLASDVQLLAKNLIAKKTAVASATLCSSAEQLLVANRAQALSLEAVIVSKIAGLSADAIASAEVIDPINGALNSLTAAFASCPGQGSGNPGPSTTSGTGSKPPGTTTTPPGNTTTPPGTTTTPPATCSSSAINTKVIKKCLKILSQAALQPPAGGYDEL